jgi:uncharacterized membrane protein YfcA
LEAFAALLPPQIGPLAAAILIIASAFTSALTASFGLGGGMAMLALMGIYLPVASLIPLHGVVQLGSNAGRAVRQRENIRRPVARPFIGGSIVGAIAGAFLVVELPDSLLKLVLGAFIIAITWLKFPWIARLSKAGLSVASAVLAVTTMFVGATGALVSPVLARFLENDRKGLVATHAAVMVVQHGLKIVVFGLAGFVFWPWLPLLAAMILSGFVGTHFGTKLLDSMNERTFQRWFRIAVTLLALDLLRRGLQSAFA